MKNLEEFEVLMRAHGPKIYTLAARLTGNLTDGQDVAQETFLKAFEHWDTFRGDAEVGTWLYRICVNVWKNRVRYEKRRSFWKHFSLDGDDPEDPKRELPSGDAPVDQPMIKSEDLASLHHALAAMKAEDRDVLVLFEMENRSYEEISQLLEIPLGTVRSRLSRSRDKLRELLEKESNKPL